MQQFLHYYVLDSKLNFDEDTKNEFKGHRQISHADVENPKIVGRKHANGTKFARTRQAVSRCLCAFLNSGNGGDVYLGVNDEGRVIALQLSTLQMDHVLLQISHVFTNFNPPVSNHLWWVGFIPVVESRSEVHERLREVQDWRSLKHKDIRRCSPHKFPSQGRCWCDLTQHTEKRHRYVIRIHLKPTKIKINRLEERLRLPMIYQCDDGKVYFRNCASVVRYSPQDVIRHTQDYVSKYYKPIVDDLKGQLNELLQN